MSGAGAVHHIRARLHAEWLADREAELLPVGYFHVVYTLPAELRDVAFQNKRVVYDLLMKAAAETTLQIAADPKRLGARIGITAVLHTWGSAMTHHPHVHMIVPGGGLVRGRPRWISSRGNFLVHVNVLARLFRGKMLAMLGDAHDAGRLKFFNGLPASPTDVPSSASSDRSGTPSGSSTSSRRSADRRPCSPTCRATPTASPSRTGGSSRPTTAASRSAGRTIARTASRAGRP